MLIYHSSYRFIGRILITETRRWAEQKKFRNEAAAWRALKNLSVKCEKEALKQCS